MPGNKNRHFYCANDRHYFLSDDYSINNEGKSESICPICKKTIEEVPWYYANLPKMWANPHQVGPQSPEAKKRSSLNGFKHGLYTKTNTLLAPALYGKYPECAACPYEDPCKTGDYKYCPINLTMILKYIQAYEEGHLEEIKTLAGLTHGWTFNILKMMIHEIYNKGTLVPKVLSEKIIPENNGDDKKQTTLEWQSNPLLKRIPEFMAALGMLAEQQLMTPSKKQDQENVAGFLQSENARTEDINKFMDEQKQKMSELQNKLKEAIKARKNDEALNEFEKEQDKDEP